MTKILRTLSKSDSVKVHSPGGYGNLLNWGEYFVTRSTARVDPNEDNGYFIVEFKKTIVHIDSYMMKAKEGGVFPKKWSLFVSNDNSTWEAIHDNTEPLCKEGNIDTVPTGEKYICNNADEFTYSTNHTGFHYFVKFVVFHERELILP